MAVVAIDWDNTLRWATEWLEGAKPAINILREKGHKIIIHSANSPDYIRRELNEAGVIVDKVWDAKGKPLADLYIDDKGYHFPYNGSWNEELPKVLDRIEGLDNRKW